MLAPFGDPVFTRLQAGIEIFVLRRETGKAAHSDMIAFSLKLVANPDDARSPSESG